MNILITGANGFVGYFLCRQLLQKGCTVIATGRGACRLPYSGNPQFTWLPMDFTNPFDVHDVFTAVRPAVVVHAGAMSKPDICEQNQWLCYSTNVEGTLNLLASAEEWKSFFLFLSTDFVFDGEQGMYTEEDAVNPVNFYGRSKADAEEAVKEYPYDWAIARTVLVYGKPVPGQSNLLYTIKEKLEKGLPYNVVNDQFRTPTFVEDLAKGLVAIIEKRAARIYHLSGKDILTPYEMALAAAHHLGLDASLLKKVTATEFAEPAKRPPRTGFQITRARNDLQFEPVSFEEGLRKTFA